MKEIKYSKTERKFTSLVIVDKNGKERYRLNGTKTDRPKAKEPTDEERRQKGIASISELVKKHKAEKLFADWLKDIMKAESLDGLTVEQLAKVYKGFKKWIES